MAEDAAQTNPDLDDPDLHKVARWVAEIDLYNKETENWRKRSKQIVRRYKDERGDRQRSSLRRFNSLWAYVQTMQPALYARNPKPDIQRRFKDADPLGRVASTVLERSVSYFCETDVFAAVCRSAVLDRLLPGRGVSWLRYEPTIEKDDSQITEDAEAGEDAAEGQSESITYEQVCSDYVNMEDFGHNIARTWDEVWVGWRVVYMSRKALKKRFGDEKAMLCPLDYTEKDLKDRTIADPTAKSTIYEVWDKDRKIAVWLHKDVSDALDLRPDPLELEDFFPFPKPLYASLANDSLIPTPDYLEFQDQAEELDNITARIASIQKSIKVAGVYNAAIPGVGTLLNEGVENKLVAVTDWASFAEKGGIESNMDLLPIKESVEAITSLYEVRAKVQADLNEISGIPDVIRGQSDPNETAEAQTIKSQFATMRISDSQREVQRFVRGMIRIMVDIIANHFQIETIKKISGVQLFTQAEKEMVKQLIAQYQQASQQAQQAGQPPPPMPQPPNGMTQDQIEQMMSEPTWDEVEALIRNKALRCFKIDIETDSTIKADEEAEKASRVEFLKALGEFLKGALEVGQEAPAMVPVMGQALMFGMRAFPVGKDLEGAMSVALTKLEKAAQNPNPKPNPEMMKIQADAQAAQQKLAADQQLNTAKIQSEQQLAQMRAQLQAQSDQHRNELEAARDQARLQAEMQLAQVKEQNLMDIERMKLDYQARTEETVANIKAAASIEVARIAAAQSSGEAAEARASADASAGEEIKASVAQVSEKLAGLQGHVDGLVKGAQVNGASHTANDNTDIKTALTALMTSHAKLADSMNAEKEIVRGPDGKAMGVRTKAKPQDLAAAIPAA